MDISLLKTFLEVARLGHFGKAADALFVTQSAVSARIKLLESSLGVTLFNRRRNDIQLTPAGLRLRKHAETIVRGWDRARQEIALEPECNNALAVGCQYDLWKILIGNWAAVMRRQQAGTALHIELQAADILVQRVVAGVFDLVFVFEPPQIPGLEIRQVMEISLLLVSGSPGLSAAEAMEQDYLMVDWGSAFAHAHAEHFPDSSSAVARLGSGVLALDMLLTGGGAAYLAERMVQQPFEQGSLFRVDDAPVITRSAFAVYRSGSARQHLIEAALEVLRDTVAAGDKLLLQNQLVRMRQLAFHDALTGLANRALFREQLAVAMSRAERREELLAVLMLDLDGFKTVNDRFGHAAGDALLQQCSQRLNVLVRRSDGLARLGGDEFIILLEGVRSTSGVEEVAQKILDAIAQPFDIGAASVRVGGSLGIAYFPFEKVDLDTLMHQADMALYEAKAQGKNRFIHYQRNMGFLAH
jgi:diguanylate cyclase (GGDEF)-like protein